MGTFVERVKVSVVEGTELGVEVMSVTGFELTEGRFLVFEMRVWDGREVAY